MMCRRKLPWLVMVTLTLVMTCVGNVACADGFSIIASDFNWPWATARTYDGPTGEWLSNWDLGGEYYPYGVATGTDGYIYVCTGEHTASVVRFNLATGVKEDIITTGLSGPQGIAFGPDGNLYIANRPEVHGVEKLDLVTRQLVRFANVPEHPFDLQWAKVNGEDHLFVLSCMGAMVYEFNATGEFVRTYDTPAEGFGLTVGGGYIYTHSRTSGGQIRKINMASGAIVWSRSTGYTEGRGIELGPDGMLYLAFGQTTNATSGYGCIKKFDPQTGAEVGTVVRAQEEGGNLQNPTRFDFGPAPSLPKILHAGNIEVNALDNDWADATWIDAYQHIYTDATNGEWTESDISQDAKVAFKWNENKVYLFAKVKDTNPVFSNGYVQWDASDRLEMYIHTTGYQGVYWDPNGAGEEIAQQYTIGLNLDGIAKWSALGGGSNVPASADFSYAVRRAGDYYYYEAAMTPFHYFGGLVAGQNIPSPLRAGDKIRVDMMIDSVAGNTKVYSQGINSAVNKHSEIQSLALWTLTIEGVAGSVGLKNYGGSKTGLPMTMQVKSAAGPVLETHNVVLDAGGGFSFTTSLRGEYTIAAKASHWLAQAVSVVIDSTGSATPSFNLINGDCDGNNQVTTADAGIVIAAFGKLSGDSGWDARADLDGDGEITALDYNIVLAEYGKQGD